jgi:hypothetical protein
MKLQDLKGVQYESFFGHKCAGPILSEGEGLENSPEFETERIEDNSNKCNWNNQNFLIDFP